MMTSKLFGSVNLTAIDKEVRESDGLLRDIWFNYRGDLWFPVLIRDRRSGKQGFEVNFSGKWGSNDSVGRKKLDLAELVVALAENAIPPDGAIRCKRVGDKQRNGRRFSEVQMSIRFGSIITKIRDENHSK